MTIKYTDDNLYNMSTDIAKLLRNMIKDFREEALGFPTQCSEQDWNYILIRMEDGFEAALELADNDGELSDKDVEKLQHRFDVGIGFFKDYFFDLWG